MGSFCASVTVPVTVMLFCASSAAVLRAIPSTTDITRMSMLLFLMLVSYLVCSCCYLKSFWAKVFRYRRQLDQT